MKEDEVRSQLWGKNVPDEVLERISNPHSKEVPAVPFAWMVSYTSEGALQNMRYFENGVRHCSLQFPIRVFLSSWTDAIVVSFVPLEAIKEIHVMEWSLTFYEVPFEEARERLKKFPRFPYDGRNPVEVRAAIIVNGGYQKLIADAKKKYAEMGIRLPDQANWMDIYSDDQP